MHGLISSLQDLGRAIKVELAPMSWIRIRMISEYNLSRIQTFFFGSRVWIQTLLGGVTLKIWLILSKCFYLQEEEACTVYSVLYLYANEKSDPDPNRNVSEPAKPEHN